MSHGVRRIPVGSDCDVHRNVAQKQNDLQNEQSLACTHTLSELNLLLPLAWRSLLMYALQSGDTGNTANSPSTPSGMLHLVVH